MNAKGIIQEVAVKWKTVPAVTLNADSVAIAGVLDNPGYVYCFLSKPEDEAYPLNQTYVDITDPEILGKFNMRKEDTGSVIPYDFSIDFTTVAAHKYYYFCKATSTNPNPSYAKYSSDIQDGYFNNTEGFVVQQTNSEALFSVIALGLLAAMFSFFF